ncbi:uncharacterized protein [Aegilops tauschii subsp. strangulata]|uniref:uncharacterized protein isoform X2 n=2 Tax=Triticinae TaxID=1648030 RepID=UPI003CC86286
MAHLPLNPPCTSWFHEFPPTPYHVPSSGPPLRRGFPDARPRRSRRHAAGAASPIGGGSGGARDTLQRAPPLQALDAHQRVQGNRLDPLLGMVAVSSCGCINTRRIDDLLRLLLPCVGEQTSDPRISSASSRARSDGAAADAEENEPEASAGRSTQVLLAAAASGGRGGPYGRRPSSSHGSCAPWNSAPLIAHPPATPSPVCCPIVALRQEQEQGRLPTREDLVKCFSMPRNIRLQTPRHPSLPDMRVDGSNRGPPKFVHKATPARLMRRARSSHNYHGKRMEAIDAVNEWRLPKVSAEEDGAVDQKAWQDDTMSCRVSSARDWNFGSDSVYEGPAMKHKENAVHAKLVAWKDAQVSKLIDKLKAQIDEWQKNKFTWARDKLAKTEKKLEKQRTETVVKMQKAIEDAERKDDMKSQEEAAAKSKIASFERALQVMSRAGRQADCQILMKGPYTVQNGGCHIVLTKG